MKPSKKAQKLLARMAAIERMERGKLCKMAGRDYYNLQAWHNGKNEVRYVRQEEREAMQQALDGYALFTKLARQYADEVIKQTRREHRKQFPKIVAENRKSRR
jgi:hypothetical protein